jgi:hypothetical protein
VRREQRAQIASGSFGRGQRVEHEELQVRYRWKAT